MKKEFTSSHFKSERKGNRRNHPGRTQSKGKSEPKQQIPTVAFMMISDDEGAVSIPYQVWADPIKTLIKQRGAVWCPVFKVWKTSKVNLQFIKRDLPSLLTANYEDSPSFVKLASQPISDLHISGVTYQKDTFDLKSHRLYDKLYPFQRETLEFSLSRHGRILIADEMGVGKSLQSLACNLLYPEAFPLLIICPSALKHVWRDEVLKWYQSIISSSQIMILKKGSLKPGQLKPAKVVIVSYQIASKLTEELKQYKSVICDEAHYLKNPETNRCSQLIPLLMQKKRIFLLTGTPALAKPRELFNLLRILRPDIFTKLQDFGNRYCFKRQNPWSHRMEFDGAKNLAELHYLLKKTIMIRRLKSDVLTDLPSKQRQIIYMQTEKSVVAEIRDTLKERFSVQSLRESEKLMDHFYRDEGQQSQTNIMRCYMLSASAKLQAIKEYVASILENDIKVIIFAHHKFVMDQLENHLKYLKYHHIKLDGEVSPETRKKKVDLFQEDSSIKVALLSVTAMGTGFTLTAASTVIFAELHWTPAILMQAQDRCHRIGQKYSVNIHYLIGEDTLDPIMLRQLQRKIGTVTKVLDGENQTLNIQILSKGLMGSFQIPTQEINKKNTKITDFFAPITSTKTQKEVFPHSQFPPISQKMKDESEDALDQGEPEGEDLDRQNGQSSDSEERFMLEYMRRKRRQLQKKEE